MSCEECGRLARGIEAIRLDLENAEVALRAERRKTSVLRKELEQRQLQHARARDVEDVFFYWREVCGHPTAKLGAARRKLVADRLDDGYTVTELKVACDGAAAEAFINAKGKVFDDLALVCRSEVKVDDFIERGRRANRRAKVEADQEKMLRVWRSFPGGVVEQSPQTWGKCPVCRDGWEVPSRRSCVLERGVFSCKSCGAKDRVVRAALLSGAC